MLRKILHLNLLTQVGNQENLIQVRSSLQMYKLLVCLEQTSQNARLMFLSFAIILNLLHYVRTKSFNFGHKLYPFNVHDMDCNVKPLTLYKLAHIEKNIDFNNEYRSLRSIFPSSCILS